MLLPDKTAVIYGATGHVGSAIARVFAREGARVHLTGRKPDPLDALAAEIGAAGADLVDATDREQVERHLDGVGAIDISVNAVSLHGTVMGTPLIEMDRADFLTPVSYGLTAHFTTATAAARRMAARGSGAILTLSTSGARLPGRDQKKHLTGGFGTACGAIELFSISLAGEVGPNGVRVVCLRPDALPETWPADQTGAEPSEFFTFMTGGTVLNRLPKLAEVAEAAAFAASDRASALTRTVLNLSCGSVLD
jgi:3-oxoacyl-[acyl-carrier protein] reductase